MYSCKVNFSIRGQFPQQQNYIANRNHYTEDVSSLSSLIWLKKESPVNKSRLSVIIIQPQIQTNSNKNFLRFYFLFIPIKSKSRSDPEADRVTENTY